MELFDSHSHINAREFAQDRAETINRMKTAGLAGAMVIGCDRDEIEPVADLVRAYPGYLYGAWALHPEYEDVRETSVEEILSVCSRPEFIAVGETGLDYHWCHGDLTWQKERFRMHIEAARTLGKPLIVHARDSEADALDILLEHHAGDVGFVLHCFSGSAETARRCVDAGGMISVTGVLTFKNATALQEIVRAIPLQSLMIETDCPYMAPVPRRGKRNEPAYVAYVAAKMAELKGITPEECGRITLNNAYRFFRINNETTP